MADKTIVLLFDLVAETQKLAEKIQDHHDRYGHVCKGRDCDESCPIADAESLIKMCTDLGLTMYFFEAALVHEQHHFPDRLNN